MTQHWLDLALKENRQLNLVGHINRPRISAETILKLVQLKNEMLGINRSLYEESMIAEEKGQTFGEAFTNET